MSQYVTTHNAEGKAVFSTKLPSEPNQMHMQGDPARGSLQMVYSVDSFEPNLSSEEDIDAFDKVRKEGLPQGLICPPHGVAASIVTFGRHDSPWHRTMTLDFIYILEGIVELHLDGGEKKTLKAGDVVTQRGTMHMWRNVTPNDGAAKLLGFAMPIQQPLDVGGQQLGTEWRF